MVSVMKIFFMRLSTEVNVWKLFLPLALVQNKQECPLLRWWLPKSLRMPDLVEKATILLKNLSETNTQTLFKGIRDEEKSFIRLI